ncbi:sel1 repeat family protein [Methylosinus sp. H3A]|nr:sel1 repeat family protein [Methylosinus sp. H3A]
MRRQILVLAAMLSFGAQASAGPRDEMLAAYAGRKYSAAFALAKPLAEQNDEVAQFVLGTMLHQGLEVPKNLEEAAIWLRKSAEKGNVGAQQELGFLLAFETKQRAEGRKWLEKAVEAKHPRAFRDLGWLTESERPDAAGLSAAADLYRRGAERGDGEAQWLYANALLNGRGVAKDEKAAANLYCTLSSSSAKIQCAQLVMKGALEGKGAPDAVRILQTLADQGNAPAKVRLAEYFIEGPASVRNIAEGVRLLELAAEKGDASAYFDLGWLATSGTGMDKNLRAGFDWYRKSAEAGHARAYGRMGKLLAEGINGKPDPQEAVRLFRLGAERNDPFARERLAAHLNDGIGVEKDRLAASKLFCEIDTLFSNYFCAVLIMEDVATEKDKSVALALMRKAVEGGEAEAQRVFGHYLLEGKYVDKNVAEGVRLTKLAAEGGSRIAFYNLGYIYEDGLSVQPDGAIAFEWYKKAADAEYGPAFTALGRLTRSAAGSSNAEAAVETYKKGAARGDENAAFQLAYAMRFGLGTAKNELGASDIFCRQTSVSARYHCAISIINGKAREKDKRIGFSLLNRLAQVDGDSDSQIELAYYFLNGIILKKDLKEGLRLMEMSVEQDNAAALFTKGNLFEKGVGVQKNLEEASRWYQLSAEKNFADALVALGKFYEKGVIGKADRAEALKFYRRAAAIGNVEGKTLADRLSGS